MAIPLVGNPAAGGGRGAVRLRETAALLGVRGLDVERVDTTGPGDATRLVRELAEAGEETVLVCGGDGTISEACEGALTATRPTTLGFLPAGTGNDFLRDFGITDRRQAADRIVLGRPRAIDAARVTTADGVRHFVNVLVTGLGARAGARAAGLKWMGGGAYTAAVLYETLRLRSDPTRLVLDGAAQDASLAMVAVCNSAHTGGAMRIAPQARPDDGELDVMTVEGTRRLELLKVFPRIFDGGHVRHKKVRMHRARRVSIEPRTPSPLLLDGDIWSCTPAQVEVLPGALSILC